MTSKCLPLVILFFLVSCARQPDIERREVYDLLEQAQWAPQLQKTDSKGILVDSGQGILWIANGQKIDYFLKIPMRSSVALDRLRAPHEGHESVFSITFERAGDEKEHLIDELKSVAEPRILRLPDGASEICRLSFTAKSPAVGNGGFAIWRPRIVTEVEPGQAEAVEPTGHGEERQSAPNIIIYLVDTLRKDHLGVYGYEQPISPAVDAFAAEATVFDHAVAQSPWTRPSIASIFTGLEPNVHGVNRREDSLPDKARTLAETLSENGYQTVGIFTNGNAGPPFGFDQGFEISSKSKYLQYHANYLNEKASSYLTSDKRREPFFLYIHAVDPHAPYEAFEPYFSCIAGQVKHPELGDLDLLNLESRNMDAKDLRATDVLALYDAEIAFNDDYFGQFLAILKALGLYDGSLIVFVADHGEEFWDHGRWSHGQSLYGELIDIPLIVKWPYQKTPARTSVLAQHIDLFATALDYAGVDYTQYTRGRSLGRHTGQEELLSAYSKMDVDGREAVSVTEDEWKLIVPRNANAGTQPMLFNRRLDHSELQDLYGQEPLVSAYMMTLLRRHESAGQTALESASAEINEEVAEELRALGYLE